jgi:NAD(P)-dependent dehydrogenase (short-subunit alcohol dehydrogenase family)
MTFNGVAPTITDALAAGAYRDGGEGDARIRARLSRVPTEEIVSPEDLARAVYLVLDDSEGITGILPVVNGGLTADSEFDAPA